MVCKDIVGKEETKKWLVKEANGNRVAHAKLICGGEGVGTLPMAIAYARYLNCKQRTTEDACGKCPSCLKFDALAHPDLHFVYPIVATKERKKEICDDYLPEWRSFVG